LDRDGDRVQIGVAQLQGCRVKPAGDLPRTSRTDDRSTDARPRKVHATASAVSIQLMPDSIACWMAATESASS
jgi:hypothetical protein